MKIALCIRQGMDNNLPLSIDPVSKVVRQENSVSLNVLGLPERAAIEEALCLKAEHQAEVTAFSIGGPEAVEALRYALVCGVDRAVHLVYTDEKGLDPFQKAALLAGQIDGHGFDLVLCGKRGSERGSGLTPAALAEALKAGQVSGVVSLTVDPQHEQLLARRDMGRGDREEVLCGLPAVAAMSALMHQPRYIPLHLLQLMDITRIERVEVTRPQVGAPAWQVSEVSPPRPRPRRIAAPDAKLSASDRLKFLMGGGQARKSGAALEGSPEQAADQIVTFLEENGLI